MTDQDQLTRDMTKLLKKASVVDNYEKLCHKNKTFGFWIQFYLEFS